MLPTANYALGSLIAAADSGSHISNFYPPSRHLSPFTFAQVSGLIDPPSALAARLWLDTCQLKTEH